MRMMLGLGVLACLLAACGNDTPLGSSTSTVAPFGKCTTAFLGDSTVSPCQATGYTFSGVRFGDPEMRPACASGQVRTATWISTGGRIALRVEGPNVLIPSPGAPPIVRQARGYIAAEADGATSATIFGWAETPDGELHPLEGTLNLTYRDGIVLGLSIDTEPGPHIDNCGGLRSMEATPDGNVEPDDGLSAFLARL